MISSLMRGDSILEELTLLLVQVGVELLLGKLRPEHHLPALDSEGKDFGSFNMAWLCLQASL